MPPATFRPAVASDREAILDQLAAAFPHVPRERFAASQQCDPHFRPGDTFLALVDGRPVSHVLVRRRRTRLPGGHVAFGCIGGVSTHPDHRGRGPATVLLRLAIAHMAWLGHPLSVPGTGIPEFYARHGWEVMPEPLYALDATLDKTDESRAHGAPAAAG